MIFSHSQSPIPLDIKGYTPIEQLYQSDCTLVYRGVRDLDIPGRQVVLKLLRPVYPSFSELVRFRHQYSILKKLKDCPGIVPVLALESWQNSYVLVMEDDGSINLAEWMEAQNQDCAEGRRRDRLTIVLNIAIQLANILHHVHQNRVIHKDIKPTNILIHPDTQQVKLIDFSIATLLPRESQEIVNPNQLEGTLSYIAPEQTGRMNRGIDYRADFYSLGVTLYELLAGKLPFDLDRPLELIHAHLALVPPPLDRANPSLPIGLARIVTKLMAKNVEERYQSALGIKHDLELALSQLETTGKIAEFPLGDRDVSDRFTIPEKLYGREQEIHTLLRAFDRVTDGKSELMLVAGNSGVGKTAVINEVHKPITRQHSYFIKGKFDQFNRHIPRSAFVRALRDLVRQLLAEADDIIAEWRAKILAVVGENGGVLIDVIPELAQIIGIQPPAPELAGTAAQNRFNLLFQKFIAIFATADRPLVIFLDDWQWADLDSLSLLELILKDSNYILILGAYRDNEVSPLHSFIQTVDKLRQNSIIVQTLNLQPLIFEDINHLVADTLHCSLKIANPFTESLVRKTKGNPFFTTQMLTALAADGHIKFNRRLRYWECDLTQINSLTLTDDVAEFMALQLQKLSTATQEVLKLAACMGDRFDLHTLAIVSAQSLNDTATALWEAIEAGLILPNSQIYKFFQDTSSLVLPPSDRVDIQDNPNPTYRFLHDRVQQAAYSLISDDRHQATHLKIGRLLLANTPKLEIESRLFEIVNQIDRGLDLITDRGERDRLAELNYQAGQKAYLATAYTAALNYVQAGISLLGESSWQNQYHLTLNLHQTLAAILYADGRLTELAAWIDLILDRVDNLFDRIPIYEIKISSLIAKNQIETAIKTGLEVLAQMQIKLPNKGSMDRVLLALMQTKWRLRNRKISSLLELHPMGDDRALAAMQILSILLTSTLIVDPLLFVLILCKQIELSLRHGNHPRSALAYACYGTTLCGFVNDIESGYQFGQIGINLLNKFNDKSLSAKVLAFGGLTTVGWKQHLKDTIPLYQLGYHSGVAVGDLEPAAWNAINESYTYFYSGTELTELLEKVSLNSRAIERLQQTMALDNNEMLRQVVLNLLGQSTDSCELMGTAYNEEKSLLNFQATNNRMSQAYLHTTKLMLYYLFGRIALANRAAQSSATNLESVAGMPVVALFHFYNYLTKIAIYPTIPIRLQREIRASLRTSYQKMQHWAKFAPMNFQHKLDLMTAEQRRLEKQPTTAIDYYDRAIAGAKTYGYLQEEALANELAAKFYLEWGKDRIATSYIQEAYYCYARWGAKAKTDELEKRYPELLRPILEQRARSLDPLETLVNLTNPSLAISVSRSQQTSTGRTNTTIDLAAIIQAAQSLSSTIDLEELLQQLAKIILQYSGGDRCALILPDRSGEWQVRAIATPETTQIHCAPLTGNPNLPTKIIQYVKNTQEIVVVNDLQTELPVIDEYLLDRHPKSLLCLPILKQGELIGILYLKNRSISGAFNHDCLPILNFLCTQAAISLENARLFAETRQTEASLRQSQLQLQNTANNLPGIVYQFRLDADGNPSFPFISDRARELMGFEPQTLQESAVTAIQCMEPPDREMFQMLVAESIETLEPFFWTGRFNLPSGEQKWIEARSIPTRQADGAIVWDGVMLDVSERKLAETNLALSEAKFRSLVEDANDVIYSFDLTGTFTYLSPKLEEITGYQPAKLIGRSAADFTHPEDIPLMMASIQELLTTQTKQNGLEIRIPRKNGGWCWVVFNNSPVKDSNGQIIGIQGIGRDVTAEKAIRQERQRQADALQAIVEGTAGKTGADFYQACTKYLAKIFDVKYAFLTRLLDPDFKQIEMLSLWTGEGFVEPYVMELAGTPCLATYQNSWSVFPSALQSHFPNASTLTTLGGESYLSVVIRDFEGKILGNLGIIDTKPLPPDTSALRFILQIFANRVAAEMKRQADEDALIHTNHRLEFTVAELQRATRLKDEFLAAMSHELRTPLNAILGLAEGLQEEVFGAINPRQLKSLCTIERSGRHLLSLINDILDLSKISAGKLELDLTQVSVVSLCKSSLTFVKEQAHQKQIALTLDLPPTLAPIIADERRLHQVVINLLSNAVKFTPAGGKVALGVEFQSTPTEGERLYVWVKDTGIGIAREDVARLFQPFTQIDSRLNRHYEGTGLGLSLVKQIIELHGGTVGVESELGQGSCFYFHLPYQSTNAAVTAQTDSTKTLTLGTSLSVATRSHSPQILLVEDNEANIATISDYLSAKGYHITIATSGCEAIDIVKRELPQLILMDIQMPEMDGLATISHLRQHPPCADTPIIALTALAMPGDREKCLVAGANDYLTKPVALKQLALTIEQWLATEFDLN